MGIYEELLKISERMRDQDNRMTSHPIFIVQQKQRIYGLNNDYVDNSEEMPGGEEIGYKDIWEFVQPFFSCKAAEDYIAANRHNLTDPQVYVESAYRNKEWQAVRGVLVSLDRAELGK